MKDIPADKDLSIESLLGQAADEFTRRCASGEQPDIEEYAARYPQIAAVIREVFPALQVMPAPAVTGAELEDLSAAGQSVAGILGDYRLIREVGRGGMGVVYEAEQISLGRRVALKVLSFAAVLDSKQLQRFKNEAQAAAQLHHTNIVPVFSVGCERGVHYYAMQYIEGHPLSAVIRELRQAGGLDLPGAHAPSGRGSVKGRDADITTRRLADRSGPAPVDPGPSDAGSGSSAAAGLLAPEAASGLLDAITGEGSTRGRAYFRSVVTLAVQAAEALQHAHERGVIHRDIKPSNLLLDTDGRLWVTDFGLAIMQTDPGLTLTGDLLGTIRYMSPEQALAKRVPVDHRTDIYSFGVTLYELLTLEPAYPGRDRQELLRQIAFEEPRSLRQLNRAIPRELETIVGKAMAKNPGERYGTAQELADDLRRFLGDKPILAKPPTLLDRAAKWSRRHRSAVAAGIILLALSVVGLSASTVMIARERAKAMRERDAAQEQKRQAEQNLQKAHEVVSRMLADVSAVDPALTSAAERLRLNILQEALVAAQTLADRSPEPAARRNLAAAQMQLAHTYAQLGQGDSAEQAYREAAGVLEKLRNDAPGVSDYTTELAQADLCLGIILWEQRRYAEAETLARQAGALATALVNESAQSQPYRLQLAGSLDLLGRVLRDTGRFAEAETSFRESMRLRRAIVGELSQSVQRRQQSFELACTQRNLADLLLKTGRRDEAENTSRESITTLEHLTNWFPDVDLYAKELARTRRWWDEVLRLADPRAVSGANGSAPPAPVGVATGFKQMVARTLRILNDALEGEADPQTADAAYREAVGLVEQMARQSPADVEYREALFDLHRAQAARKRELWLLDEAEAAFQKAIDMIEPLAAEFPDKASYRDLLEKMRSKLDN
ncbi:MAG TPA: serine/threonine-protein kinase, partial [Phycisphaerae bacterium]|nr:serine/threonine-protein kinase [Phycisphaerae bacterium]